MSSTAARRVYAMRKTLIGTCLGVYAAPRVLSMDSGFKAQHYGQKIHENTVLTPQGAYKEGRWWTLLTYSFQHGNVLHLAVNLFALNYLGSTAGLAFGPSGLAWLWAGGAVTGGVLAVNSSIRRGGAQEAHVGASGSLCAMASAIACAAPRLPFYVFPIPKAIQAWKFVLGLGAFSLVADGFQTPPDGSDGFQISHMGHVGGLCFGAAWFAALRMMRRF